MKIELIKPFGALVTADKFGQSIINLPANQIIDLLEQHLVIVFRGFSLVDDNQYVTFARQFGTLLSWEFGEVLELKIENNPANHIFSRGRVELHWDGAFVKETPRYNIFQCLEAPDGDVGGKTLFVDTQEVWRTAGKLQRDSWQKLVLEYTTEKKAHYGGTIRQPLISTNPFSNEKIIRYIEGCNEDNAEINPVQITIDNQVQDPDDPFIQSFTKRLYQDDVMYRHSWRQGDFLIADNNSLLHGRSRFKTDLATRIIKRINVL